MYNNVPLQALSHLYKNLSETGQDQLVRALIVQLPRERENTERVLRDLLERGQPLVT
jgi:hypothetical protein